MEKELTYIILCGGKSSRMGEDKGSMKVSEKPMIIHILDKLNHNINEAIIVLNNKKRIEKYSEIINNKKYTYTIRYIEDEIKNKGPLAGIQTGLKEINTEYAQILPCDSPYITKEFIKNMQNILNTLEEVDAIIPYHIEDKTKNEPLHGIYSKKYIKKIDKLIKENKLSIKEYFKQINPYYIPIDNIKIENINFENLNTKEDVKKWEKNNPNLK